MRIRPAHAAFAACVFFFLAGQLFIPRLGIEDDEALFASGIFGPRSDLYAITFGDRLLPVMIMSYIGALKTWLMRPVLNAFGASVWAIREPAMIAGVASIWLTYVLVRRMAGARAAVIATILLATDPLYLLTTCFDWGPVALQHLLVIAAVYLIVRFAQNESSLALAGAFFLFGLALWDKAVAAWMLAGLATAAILIFHRDVRRLATPRRIVIATLAFAAGSLPLITYNIASRGGTFRGNIGAEQTGIAQKAAVLLETANGRGLFGYLTASDQPRPAHTADGPRSTLFPYALALALLCWPLAGAKPIRPAAFAAVATAAAWLLMALNAGTGGSVHHTILLWPWPIVFVAVSFAAASKRPIARHGLIAVTVLLAAGNILVANTYRTEMKDRGGSPSWTDAIFPLADRVKSLPVRNVYCADWGITDSLRLVSRGKVPVRDISGLLKTESRDVGLMTRIITDDAAVFITHTSQFEFFPGTAETLIKEAAQRGYRPQSLAVINDSFGRPMFEVLRFTTDPASARSETTPTR